MTKLPTEFYYWKTATNKAAVAREQVARCKPDDLMPTGHRAGLFITALTSSERKEVAAWYRDLAKASPDRVDSARYQAFAKVMDQ